MALETQLEKLKKEIVEMHRGATESVEKDDQTSEALEQNMLEYEEISAQYNDLFTQILNDSVKMKDEYASTKKT